MDRLEAQRRLFAAVQILMTEGSFTQRDVDNALSGLQREEAVEEAERLAKSALGFTA